MRLYDKYLSLSEEELSSTQPWKLLPLPKLPIQHRSVSHSHSSSFFFFFYLLWSLVNLFSFWVAIHMAQPWFHSKLSRDEAHKLITQHGLIDGYFLLTLRDHFYSSFIHTCIFSLSFTVYYFHVLNTLV